MASRADLFAAENPQRLVVDTWVSTGNATNDTATATRAGATNKSHFLASVHASFAGGTVATPVTLTVQLIGSVTMTFAVSGAGRDINFDPPLRVPEGQNVTAALAAGGSGVVGQVVTAGFSV